MRAATKVFIKETINKNDNYGKFICFEMIESIMKIKLNIILYQAIFSVRMALKTLHCVTKGSAWLRACLLRR